MKKKAVRRNIIIALVIGFTLILVAGFNQSLKIEKYQVRDGRTQEPIRIVFLADLHSCQYGEKMVELINAIKYQRPDLVLLGGDIIDDEIPMDNVDYLLASIGEDIPCFYVSGNHEVWTDQLDQLKLKLENYGVTVLEGDCVTVTIRGQDFNICGVDDPAIGNAKYAKQVKACSEENNKRLFSIFLTHRPERVDTYIDAGFDFILAGHAHGGQWRFPPFCNGVYAPTQKWFPKYVGGEYEIGSAKMIVSRGLARETNQLPRFFNRPELVVIDILPD